MKTQTTARAAHHRALETLRAPSCRLSGLQLWRRLRQLESTAHRAATAFCNGERISLAWGRGAPEEYDFRGDPEAWPRVAARVRAGLQAAFGRIPHGAVVNADARGCALKLDPDATAIPAGMRTDWGGYGLLAAEIHQPKRSPMKPTTQPHAAGQAAPYAGHLERGPDRIYNGPTIRLDLSGWGGAVELGFAGCTMAEDPDKYAAFIVRACNSHAALVEALRRAEMVMRGTAKQMWRDGGYDTANLLEDVADEARAALAKAKEDHP